MTKFKTILRLSEIKGMMDSKNIAIVTLALESLIKDLSREFQEEGDGCNCDCEYSCCDLRNENEESTEEFLIRLQNELKEKHGIK